MGALIQRQRVAGVRGGFRRLMTRDRNTRVVDFIPGWGKALAFAEQFRFNTRGGPSAPRAQALSPAEHHF